METDTVICVTCIVSSQHNCGDIGGFSIAVVELLFAPDEVGEYTQQFQLVFSHETVQPVSQHAVFT